MPLIHEFRAFANQEKARKSRKPPFGLRLTASERQRLEHDAAGLPIGTYIKAKVFGGEYLPRSRGGMSVADQHAHAKALAVLGNSRLTSNLNQIAHAVNIGVLPVTPETEAELYGALRDIRAVRDLMMTALGMKPGDQP